MFPSKPWLVLLPAFQAMQGCTSLLCRLLRGSIQLARLVLVHVCQSPATESLCTALPRAGTHLASRVILMQQSPTAIENTKLDLLAATNIHIYINANPHNAIHASTQPEAGGSTSRGVGPNTQRRRMQHPEAEGTTRKALSFSILFFAFLCFSLLLYFSVFCVFFVRFW